MSTVDNARNACAGAGVFRYQRHQLGKALLYQLVSKPDLVFERQLAGEGGEQPGHVQLFVLLALSLNQLTV